jgi:hypothetical protein
MNYLLQVSKMFTKKCQQTKQLVMVLAPISTVTMRLDLNWAMQVLETLDVYVT